MGKKVKEVKMTSEEKENIFIHMVFEIENCSKRGDGRVFRRELKAVEKGVKTLFPETYKEILKKIDWWNICK
jgi:hypothetical protein